MCLLGLHVPISIYSLNHKNQHQLILVLLLHIATPTTSNIILPNRNPISNIQLIRHELYILCVNINNINSLLMVQHEDKIYRFKFLLQHINEHQHIPMQMRIMYSHSFHLLTFIKYYMIIRIVLLIMYFVEAGFIVNT